MNKTPSIFLFLLLFISINHVGMAEQGFVGKVMLFNGVLSATGANNKVRVLSRKSKIYKGDVIYTEKDSYAKIRFTDGGSIVIRPESSVKIDDYFYQKDKPEKDSMVTNLLKGGMRAITGEIGKRKGKGKESYNVTTPIATIGIRGTIFGVLLCSSNSCAGNKNSGELKKGMYVDVSSGGVVVTSKSGSSLLSVGKIGYLGSSNAKLEILKTKPGGVKFKTPAMTNTNKPAGSVNAADSSQGCQM